MDAGLRLESNEMDTLSAGSVVLEPSSQSQMESASFTYPASDVVAGVTTASADMCGDSGAENMPAIYHRNSAVLTPQVAIISNDSSSEGYEQINPAYTVVSSSTAVSANNIAEHEPQLLDKVGSSDFSLQTVGSLVSEGSPSAGRVVALPQHFIISDMLDTSELQIGQNGEIYKLIVHSGDKNHAVALDNSNSYQQQQQLECLLAGELNGAAVNHCVMAQSEAATDGGVHVTVAVTADSQWRCLVCDCLLAKHRSAVSLHDSCLPASRDPAAVKLRQLALEAGCSAELFLRRLQPLAVCDDGVARCTALVCHSCSLLLDTVDTLNCKLEQLQLRLHLARQQLLSRLSKTDTKYADQTPSQASPDHCTVNGSSCVASTDHVLSQEMTGKCSPAVVICDDTDVGSAEQQLANRATTVTCAGNIGVKRSSSAVGDIVCRDGVAMATDTDSADCNMDRKSDSTVSAVATASLSGPDDIEQKTGDTRHVVHQCSVCGRQFSSQLVMRLHQMTHENSMISADGGTSTMFGTAHQTIVTAVPELRDSASTSSLNLSTASGDNGGAGVNQVTAGLLEGSSAIRDHFGQQRDDTLSVDVAVKCPVCWQTVECERKLRLHLAAHCQHSRCPLCVHECETKSELIAHVTRVHVHPPLRTNFCELCQKNFDDGEFLEHARQVHHVSEELISLERRFQEAGSSSTAHVEQHEKPQVQDVVEEQLSSECVSPAGRQRRRFTCFFCDRSFVNRASLDNHRRTHTGERPFTCSECQRSFSSKQACQAHVRAFHCFNPFTCKQCGRRCESRASFDRHMRSHGRAAPAHQCGECGKKMTTGYSLNVHMRAVHLRALPFRCNVCDKMFAYKSSLTMHQNIHTGDKQFVCEVCGKCFGSRSSLRTHMHSHNALKPHMCEWCESGFSRKDLLARHKLQVHGIASDKPYSRLTKRRSDLGRQMSLSAASSGANAASSSPVSRPASVNVDHNTVAYFVEQAGS